MEVMIAHARDEVVPPSQLLAGVPADLERVILRCLAKKPQDRFQDTDSLEQALAECAAADQWTQAHAARWWQENEQTGQREDRVNGRMDVWEAIQMQNNSWDNVESASRRSTY
jgi:hypothetical protein